MPIQQKAKTTEVLWDGVDIVKQTVTSTALDTSSAVSNLGGFVAPGDLTLAELHLRRLGTISADAVLNLGQNADPDALIDAIAINGSAGYAVLDLTDSTVVSLSASRGDYLSFELEADADATSGAAVSITAVWVPTASHT